MAEKRKSRNILCLFFITAALFLFIQSQSLGKNKTAETGSADMLRYYAVNVGQGDCTFFAFPDGQNMMVDAGTPKSCGAIKAFLKEHKVKQIDLFVATHPHSDHIGSACSVIRNFNVKEVWDSGYVSGSKYQKDLYGAIKADKKIAFKVPPAGYVRNFGGVSVKVLAPVRILKGTNSDANNNSIVMLVTYGDVSFLMTGDMERPERDTFSIPRAEVLKAAHHGSRDGTNKWLLNRVRPKIITLSYGEGNEYGHPHKEAVKAIKAFNLIRFDTVDGTVCLATDGRRIKYNEKQVVLSE